MKVLRFFKKVVVLTVVLLVVWSGVEWLSQYYRTLLAEHEETGPPYEDLHHPAARIVYSFLSLAEQDRWEDAFQYLAEDLREEYVAYLPYILPQSKEFRNLRLLSISRESETWVWATYTLVLEELSSGPIYRDVALRYRVVGDKIVAIVNLPLDQIDAVRSRIALEDFNRMANELEDFVRQNKRYPSEAEWRHYVRNMKHDPWGDPYLYQPPTDTQCGKIYSSHVDVAYDLCLQPLHPPAIMHVRI